MAYKKQPEQDPLYAALDGLFKGIGWLVMLPFKGLFNKGPNQTQLQRVRDEYRKHFMTIEASARSPHEARHAVMQADILLDKALEFKGFTGSGVGERLKSATAKLSRETLNEAWEAHKVRNRLAHELNYQITVDDARRVLLQFKSVLRNLGVL